MALAEIKTRPALVKALEAAGITEYEISGRGASLECQVYGRRDEVLFRRKVAKWSGYNIGSIGWNYRKTAPYRPGFEHDFNNVASCHHY